MHYDCSTQDEVGFMATNITQTECSEVSLGDGTHTWFQHNVLNNPKGDYQLFLLQFHRIYYVQLVVKQAAVKSNRYFI